jgi:hypothetical protein
MGNQYNDTSVLDQFELDTVDIGGDPCHVLITLTYDLDANCYEVEKFSDGKSQDLESFDTESQASAFFRLWVKDAQRDDAENRSDA